jgi:uncharacterized phage protein (TIGR01671 family)
MREIKFRVWDNETNKFWHEGRNLSLVSLVADNLVNDDSTVLEQYTGLKDKNGVEIYEGDIICQQMRFVETNGVIFWQEDKARFAVNLDGFITTITKPQEHSYEVIGNIHENAELLEVDE